MRNALTFSNVNIRLFQVPVDIIHSGRFVREMNSDRDRAGAPLKFPDSCAFRVSYVSSRRSVDAPRFPMNVTPHCSGTSRDIHESTNGFLPLSRDKVDPHGSFWFPTRTPYPPCPRPPRPRYILRLRTDSVALFVCADGPDSPLHISFGIWLATAHLGLVPSNSGSFTVSTSADCVLLTSALWPDLEYCPHGGIAMVSGCAHITVDTSLGLCSGNIISSS